MADGHAASGASNHQRGANRSLLAIVFVTTLVLLIGGCQSGCLTGLQDGVLVSGGTGLSVRAPNGVTSTIDWPPGYVVRNDGGWVLVDPSGSIKAREGDHIQVAGGLGPDGVWHACGDITVLPT
jgi:hypothetical protein